MRFLKHFCPRTRMDIAWLNSIFSCLALLFAAFSSASAQAQGTLPEPVVQALAQANIPTEAISAILIPAEGGAPILAVQAQRPMQPASTMKVVTAQIALDTFGPAQKWQTQFLAASKPRGGVLRGGLHIRGGGDFAFSAERLTKVLRALRAQGVRSIAGDVVLDRNRFVPARLDIGVPPFDEYPDAYYNLIPDALLLNHNMLEFGLASDASKITVQFGQAIDGVRISARQLKLRDGACSDWDSDFHTPVVKQDAGGVYTVLLQGSFPRGCTINTETNVLDRNVFWQQSLRAQLREVGIVWRGKVREAATPQDAVLLHESTSDPLAVILRPVNKDSDNGMTRALFLNLGAHNGANAASTLEAGRATVHAWFDKQGIARDGLVVDNGSGLSRIETISASQLAALLQAAARSRWSAEFLASLSVAGLDGSMKRRLLGTPAEQIARIKTGTLRNAVAVAGYVRNSAGQLHVIVGLINHDNAKPGRAALDALIEWASRQNGGAP
jgi:serine-type D-Ala-D-Ala carboxypeptidase/endopeptidase (penicillin-binding protein 4)